MTTGDIRFLNDMVNALVSIGGPRAIDALLKHLQADWTRAYATLGELRMFYETIAEGLGRMGDPRSVEALAALLQNQDDRVRAVTIEALAQIGGQRAIDALVAYLETAEAEEKTAVAKALGALGDERGVTALKAAAGRGRKR
jgi:HEAT repeat protein